MYKYYAQLFCKRIFRAGDAACEEQAMFAFLQKHEEKSGGSSAEDDDDSSYAAADRARGLAWLCSKEADRFFQSPEGGMTPEEAVGLEQRERENLSTARRRNLPRPSLARARA